MGRHIHSRGFALVIVLASLIILAALVLAFMASVSTELQSSKAYSAGSNAKLFSQSAVNLAIAQISAGTSGTNASGETLAWASQPGMIRTYDTSGNAAGYYKLFSWTDMTGSGAYDATASTDVPPADWFSQKAIYTDLNQPLRLPDNGTNKLVFPIIDGNNLVTMAAVNGGKTYGSNNVPDIAGFSIAASAPVAAGANANPVPMPVKWLYLLENGKIVAPASGGSGGQASVPGASGTNQIVGRIAFWTDDESCKLNVNTASEGTYADMPRANYNNMVENALTKNQPVQGEYQRYPGHPAMTSLSTVLTKPAGVTDAAWAEAIYDLAPRERMGGSREGSVVTTKTASPVVITPDADRLFPTVDEMFFQAQAANPRQANASPMNLSGDILRRDRFFLTAFSRAPDVNLFNLPRVSIWPIYAGEDPAHLMAFDRLMAFCGKINDHIYFFQRQDPTSSTVDLPASGGATGLARNRTLMEYLRSLAGRSIPGFGQSFRVKYGSDADQILTEIFDYIRSTDLADDSLASPASRYTVAANANKAGLGQVVPIEDTATNTRGFGRFRTIQSVSLLFIANADGDVSPQTDENGVEITDPARKVAAGKVRVQAMFLLNFFDPSVGSIFDFPNFQWSVSGLNGFTWGPDHVAMSFSGDGKTFTQNNYAIDGAFYGDQFGINQTAVTAGASYVTAAIDVDKGQSLSFSGGDLTIKIMDPKGVVVQTLVVNVPGGTFPLPKLGPQTVKNLNYGGSSLGADTQMRYFTGQGRLAAAGQANAANGGAWFIDQSGGDGSGGMDVVRTVTSSSGDIRLIAARKTTPLPNLEGYPFAALNAGKWSDSGAGVMGMHNFWSSVGEPFYGAYIGRLVPNLSYEGNVANGGFNQNSITTRRKGGITLSSMSDAPRNGVGVGSSADLVGGQPPGDWDNNSALLRDGPFINKPDEGSKGDADNAPYNFGRGLTGNTLNSATLFTPNRLIPSAVTFGSLPSGVLANRPWQTLLFHPDPTGLHPGNKNRSGNGSSASGLPADHLLLDWFNMPVVEPYAISEPLSTAGRINMNYQIVPFTYIERDTGIRAVLKSEKVIAIKDSNVGTYKKSYTPAPSDIRFPVNADETLKGFQARFDSGDIFRSASEICELPIVPSIAGTTYESMATFWNSYRLTGDNSKERPYATIYPRLTTKSNTYTVYFRVQALKKLSSGDPAVWDDARDKVLGEYRGSQTIERYVDPSDKTLPDYADNSTATPLGSFYKFRVLQAKQFSP